MSFNTKPVSSKDVPTPVKDEMVAALENPATPPEVKERAREILTWYAAKVSHPPVEVTDDGDRAAVIMLTELWSGSLWRGNYRLEKRSVDGVEKTIAVNDSGEPLNW